MILRVSTLLFLAAFVTPSLKYFRYDRSILNTPAQNQQACLILDPTIFAHAGAQLTSVRLYNGDSVTPYAIDYSAPSVSAPKKIVPLNIGVRGEATFFDAAMPDESYSNVDLSVDAKDFIATVRVSGSQTQSGESTKLGSYTIFDFTRQRLGRSTVLHLPQSDFRYLHLRLEGHIHPDQVTGLSTGRLPAGEPAYVTVATSSSIRQVGRDSVVRFTVPANDPVDRIVFTPGPQPVNFSRNVTVTIAPAATLPSIDAEEPAQSRISSGNILRIHSIQNGHKIDEEHLSLDSSYYANAFASTAAPDTGVRWTIAIHNEDDTPIDLRSVALQMIARNLCFDSALGASYKLYYGDPALTAPRYDYAQLFSLERNAARPTLGPEEQNSQFQSRPDTRPFTEKHPALLWIVLVAAILLLGLIALLSSRQLRQHPQ